MVPETVSGFCLVFKSGVCPNVNVCSPSNEKRKRKKCLARTGSGLEEGGLLVFGMAPVLFPFPRPTIVAFCIKPSLTD